MDGTDLQPGEPRRRTSSTALLAAGSLTGLVLGLGGTAFAAETPATPDTGAGSTRQTATADEDAAAEQDAAGSATDELCDEAGGRAGADDGTTDDGSADATASTTSAAA